METNQSTSGAGTWNNLFLDEEIASRNKGTAFQLLTVGNIGKIKCLQSGTVILSGASRVNSGLSTGGMFSLRFVKYSGGSSSEEELPGVFNGIKSADGKAISVVAPNLIVNVEADDIITMQARADNSGATIYGSDTIFSLQYI